MAFFKGFCNLFSTDFVLLCNSFLCGIQAQWHNPTMRISYKKKVTQFNGTQTADPWFREHFIWLIIKGVAICNQVKYDERGEELTKRKVACSKLDDALKTSRVTCGLAQKNE